MNRRLIVLRPHRPQRYPNQRMAIHRSSDALKRSRVRLLEVSSCGFLAAPMLQRVKERYLARWPVCGCGGTISTNGSECPPGVPRWGDLLTNSANPAQQDRRNGT